MDSQCVYPCVTYVSGGTHWHVVRLYVRVTEPEAMWLCTSRRECVCVSEASTGSPCDPSDNQAAQEAVPPADIVFSVKTQPSAGYLVMLSPGAVAAEPPSLDPVNRFSQEAVDAGRVLYLHSRPEVWSDTFSLDVSSGLGAPLEGVRVELEVLPAATPLPPRLAPPGAAALP